MSLRALLIHAATALALTVSAASPARAGEIALWNFNDMNLGVDRGVGTLTTTAIPLDVEFGHDFFDGTTVNAQMGDPAGYALSIPGGVGLQNNGSILELRTSTLGFRTISVSWAWRRFGAGFDSVQLQWSTDGTTFNNLLAPLSPPTSFAFFGISFTPAGGVADNPLFAFRFLFNGALSPNGNVQFDNLVVQGVPVPEPTTMLLLGAGLAGIAARAVRRRRPREG